MKVFSQHRGFSILMALGITAILMIVVTGLAVMYMKELKISRLSYDEVLAQTSAEGVFEYGMLKIRNHADGFQDSMFLKKDSSGDVDAKMFALKTERSKGMEMGYEMMTQTDSFKAELRPYGFLVLPLGVGDDDRLSSDAGKESKKPGYGDKLDYINSINIDGDMSNVSWTISATKVHPDETTENIGLQGEGELKSSTSGILQLWDVKYTCLDANGTDVTETQCDTEKKFESYNAGLKEDLRHSYLTEWTVSDFLAMRYGNREFGDKRVIYREELDSFGNPILENNKPKIIEKRPPLWVPLTEEYGNRTLPKETGKYDNFILILYNNSNQNKTIDISANGELMPLLQYWIQATAQKGDASQIFKFSEDKSGVYDVLKYGYYETN